MRGVRLCLCGPLLACGGLQIDGRPASLPIPGRSMLTGLIGAALGVDRREAHRLQAIQDGMVAAIVVRKPGGRLIDYQTAALGSPHLLATKSHPSWTLAGGLRPWWREGSAITETREQWRPYLADADMTAVVALADLEPERLLAALDRPAYPLYLGRRSCRPTARIADGGWEADHLEEALGAVEGRIEYIPVGHATPRPGDRMVQISGRRDWHSRDHGGVDAYVVRARHASGSD